MTSYVLGGGCFWCLDAVYRRIRGVIKVESGYAGGEGSATYERVSTGRTGYAEAVRLTFDESVIPPATILDIFFLIHNPTTLNRQGNDVGSQYRSIMFYADETQEHEFKSATTRARQHWDDPIVTEIVPLTAFVPAEEEHQDYFNNHPESSYCSIVIEPKIVKARSHYTQWFKEE
jgi:peptide-methionine (S)-S-oxide reductase